MFEFGIKKALLRGWVTLLFELLSLCAWLL